MDNLTALAPVAAMIAPSPTSALPTDPWTWQIPTMELSQLTEAQMIPLLWQLAIPLVFAILVGVAFTLGRTQLIKLLESKATHGWPVITLYFLRALKAWFIWAAAISMAISLAAHGHALDKVSHFIFSLLWIVQLGLMLVAGLRSFAESYISAGKGDGGRTMLMNTLTMISEMIIWGIMGLLALRSCGVNVTGLVAGLGVGGIVIALAFKKVAEDIFGSLSIVMDKPFVLGDFIAFGDYMGTVERIGLKTMRIRALTGEQVVISNSDLLSGRIRNYGRMKERRQVFTFCVSPETTPAQLAKIPDIVQTAIAQTPELKLDYGRWTGFGPYGFVCEAAYFIPSASLTVLAESQHALNMALLKGLEGAKIRLAFASVAVAG